MIKQQRQRSPSGQQLLWMAIWYADHLLCARLKFSNANTREYSGGSSSLGSQPLVRQLLSPRYRAKRLEAATPDGVSIWQSSSTSLGAAKSNRYRVLDRMCTSSQMHPIMVTQGSVCKMTAWCFVRRLLRLRQAKRRRGLYCRRRRGNDLEGSGPRPGTAGGPAAPAGGACAPRRRPGRAHCTRPHPACVRVQTGSEPELTPVIMS